MFISSLRTKNLVFVPLWQKDITVDFCLDPLLNLHPTWMPVEARNDVIVHCRNKWENHNNFSCIKINLNFSSIKKFGTQSFASL